MTDPNLALAGQWLAYGIAGVGVGVGWRKWDEPLLYVAIATAVFPFLAPLTMGLLLSVGHTERNEHYREFRGRHDGDQG